MDVTYNQPTYRWLFFSHIDGDVKKSIYTKIQRPKHKIKYQKGMTKSHTLLCIELQQLVSHKKNYVKIFIYNSCIYSSHMNHSKKNIFSIRRSLFCQFYLFFAQWTFCDIVCRCYHFSFNLFSAFLYTHSYIKIIRRTLLLFINFDQILFLSSILYVSWLKLK